MIVCEEMQKFRDALDNLGDDYYCVDGNIELSRVNKVREELIRHL